MLPEPVLTSRFTGPVTCNVRWNEPSAYAAAVVECAQTRTKRTHPAKLPERNIRLRRIGEIYRCNRIVPPYWLVDLNIARAGVHGQHRTATANLAADRALCTLYTSSLNSHGDWMIHCDRARSSRRA